MGLEMPQRVSSKSQEPLWEQLPQEQGELGEESSRSLPPAFPSPANADRRPGIRGKGSSSEQGPDKG